MKKQNRLTLTTSVIMLLLAIINIVLLAQIRASQPVAEWLGFVVAALIISLGLCHLISLYGILRLFKLLQTDSFVRSAAFAFGFLSIFLLLVDVVMLQDIGHEWTSQHDTLGEWSIVFIGHGVHILYSLLVIAQASVINKHAGNRTPAIKDESLFLSVHQVGIVSAIMGLLCALLLVSANLPQPYVPGLLFICCIVLLAPYAFTILCWLFTKRKEKPSDWYDEKQFTDISRGALFTLSVSIVLAAVFYLLVTIGLSILSVLIFPLYLFVSLLLFSGSTLYFIKRA